MAWVKACTYRLHSATNTEKMASIVRLRTTKPPLQLAVNHPQNHNNSKQVEFGFFTIQSHLEGRGGWTGHVDSSVKAFRCSEEATYITRPTLVTVAEASPPSGYAIFSTAEWFVTHSTVAEPGLSLNLKYEPQK